MAATRVETKVLERLAAIAVADAGIGAARVSKGFKNFADNENWEETIRGLTAQIQGWFSVWLLGAYEVGQNMGGTLRFAAELAVYIPMDTSSDLVAAWEFALALRDKLLDSANYSAGEPKPASISVEFQRVLSDGGPSVVIFDFGAYGKGSITVTDP